MLLEKAIMCQVAFEEKALETAVENAVEALASRILNGYKSIFSHTHPMPCHVGRSMCVFQTSIIKMIKWGEPIQAAPEDPPETGAEALVPQSRGERSWNWMCLHSAMSCTRGCGCVAFTKCNMRIRFFRRRLQRRNMWNRHLRMQPIPWFTDGESVGLS